MEQSTVNRERDRQEIREHIDLIFKAFGTRDREALRRTHTEDFKGFTVRSRSTIRNRDQYLREIEHILEHQSVTGYEMLEEEFTFHGDVAVVCYLAKVYGVTRRGEKAETKLRVMDVYLRQTEGWNLAASSVSLHPDDIDRHLSAAVAARQSS